MLLHGFIKVKRMTINKSNDLGIVTKEIIISEELKRRIKKLSKISGIKTKYLIYFLIISAINEYVNLKNDGKITMANELEKLNGLKMLKEDFKRFYSGVDKTVSNKKMNSDNFVTTLRFILPIYVSRSLCELKKYLNNNIDFKNRYCGETLKKFKVTDDYLYAFLLSRQIKSCEEYSLPKFTRRKENDSENPIYRLSITDTLAESYKLLEMESGISSHEWMKYILFEYLLKRNFFNNYEENDISL